MITAESLNTLNIKCLSADSLAIKSKFPQESNKIKFLRQGLKTQFSHDSSQHENEAEIKQLFFSGKILVCTI